MNDSMTNDMTEFSKIIFDAEKSMDQYGTQDMHYDTIPEETTKSRFSTELYQLIGRRDTNIGELKVIGLSDGTKPIIKLDSIKILDNYECIIYQHVYIKSELDILEEYKMVSIDIIYNNNILCTISLEYKYNKFDLDSFREGESKSNRIMNGEYIVFLYKENSRDVLYRLNKYPGNTNVIEMLMKFVSHDKILDIYT